jgi:hypothetical protein
MSFVVFKSRIAGCLKKHPAIRRGSSGIRDTPIGKRHSSSTYQIGQGVRLGSHLTSASPAEVNLAKLTLDVISVPRGGTGRFCGRPLRIIAQRGYHSDRLRWRLIHRGMLLISLHRQNRRAAPLNDGRTVRRSRKRWKEWTFAWLRNYRRMVIRYDRTLSMYRTFFHIACALITLRSLLK